MKYNLLILTLILACGMSLYSQDPNLPAAAVSSLTASVASSSSILLTWTHNNTTDTFGYYIKASKTSFASITPPPSGVQTIQAAQTTTIGEESENGAVHIKLLDVSYTWTGLEPNATYFFKIYPYNFGNDKWHYRNETGDLVPQAQIDGPLPVTLSTFNVSYQHYIPVLSWTTQTELNNLGWNVYRSESAYPEEAMQLNQAGLIEGAGSTTTPTDYNFSDPTQITANTIYWYWIESVDYSGAADLHGPVTITIPFDTPHPNSAGIPTNYNLIRNYPNPFNPSTEISFKINRDSRISLVIYDIKGKLVKTLLQDKMVSKDDNVRQIWNGTDKYGRPVASGVYFACLINGAEISTHRMLMMK